MEPVIREYLGQIKVGRKQSYKNLALFPLLSEYATTFDYLTLDEAFAGHLIEVGEMDGQGSVPEIKVVNRAPMCFVVNQCVALARRLDFIVPTGENPGHPRHLPGAGRVWLLSAAGGGTLKGSSDCSAYSTRSPPG